MDGSMRRNRGSALMKRLERAIREEKVSEARHMRMPVSLYRRLWRTVYELSEIQEPGATHKQVKDAVCLLHELVSSIAESRRSVAQEGVDKVREIRVYADSNGVRLSQTCTVAVEEARPPLSCLTSILHNLLRVWARIRISLLQSP